MSATYSLYVYGVGKSSLIKRYDQPDFEVQSWNQLVEGTPAMAFTTDKSIRLQPYYQVQLIRNGVQVFTGFIEAYKNFGNRTFYSCKGLREILDNRVAAFAVDLQTVMDSMNTQSETGITLAAEPASYVQGTNRTTVGTFLDNLANDNENEWYLNEWEIQFGTQGTTGGTYREDNLCSYDLAVETRDFYNWVQFIPQDDINSGVYQDAESIALYGMKQLRVELSDITSFSVAGAETYANTYGPAYARLYGASKISTEALGEQIGNNIVTILEGVQSDSRIVEINVKVDSNGLETIDYILAELGQKGSALEVERDRIRSLEKRVNALNGIT